MIILWENIKAEEKTGKLWPNVNRVLSLGGRIMAAFILSCV